MRYLILVANVRFELHFEFRTFKRLFCLLYLSLVVLVPLLLVSSPALGAVEPAAGWTIESYPAPTGFSAANNKECTETVGNQFPECDSYTVLARNAGALSASAGESIVVRDMVPAGLEVQAVRLNTFPRFEAVNLGFVCEQTVSGAGTLVECKIPEFLGSVESDEELRLSVYVTVSDNTRRALTNVVRVSGGGALAQEQRAANSVGELAGFGFYSFDARAVSPDGSLDSLAGDHPYETTFTFALNSQFRIGVDGNYEPESLRDPRDFVTQLPPGLVGSILAAPQCTFSQLSSHILDGRTGCPPDTIVGHLRSEPEGFLSVNAYIYNMTPEKGYPAEFAFADTLNNPHAFYVRVVPSGDGYVLQTIVPEIPQIPLHRVIATLFGDPAAKQEELAEHEGKVASALLPVPFFTNPTNCSGEALTTLMFMDGWQDPARFHSDGTPVSLSEAQWAKAQSTSPAVIGCNALRFPVEVQAQPTTHESDKPSGMNFEIKVAQPEKIGSRATPALKEIKVSFPEGFTVDPSAGNGLAACSEEQIGWEGPGLLDFNSAPPGCPEASKIGTLELESPLVGHTLKGELFLASQNTNPYGSTFAAYTVVNDPVTGVLVKIAGKVTTNPSTGRLTAEFNENPTLPFSKLEAHFFGGPRAEFATPEHCGTFSTEAELQPWSFPDSGPAATVFDSFIIDEACPSGFAPSFAALSSNVQAGGYTPFLASFGRSDSDEELAGLSVTLPPGLLAKLAGVPLCTEAEIHEAEETRPDEEQRPGCPAASQVGTVLASTGPGPNPLQVPGKAYLTGPYNGGPYGLAVIVPAVAGPFRFGTAVVRQSLRINPRTAQATDVSDPFPTIVDGIPLRLRRVDVTLNRPQFAFNPTDCEPLQFTGTITGSPLGAPTTLNSHQVGFAATPGASSQFATPFRVTDCGALHFTPTFEVFTQGNGKTKGNGASLTAKVTYPTVPQGTDADISFVHVELPKQLPSRLETLQKACVARTFESNPANCPEASVIGYAKVHTQLLSDPLEGPVYFVSNGGEAFPNLVMVLQGDNVKVELVGDTFISKAGVTSTTFKQVPDTPFESFELVLPEKKYSALGATANLCNLTRTVHTLNKVKVRRNGRTFTQVRRTKKTVNTTLQMPNEFIGQNGIVIKEDTTIQVTGCPKTKALRKPKHKKP